MKNRNQILKLLLVCVLIIMGIGVYVLTKSGMFLEDNPKKIKTIILNNKVYRLDFYYIPSNASSQSYVQIRKKYENKRELIFENYERYQGVGDYKVMNDTTLMFLLLDTVSYTQRKDTVFIKLK